jgi:hypothetical protein
MASDAYKQMQAGGGEQTEKKPKHKSLIKMLTFRVVPAYYKEIENVANRKKVTVSKLIRTYILEGMKRDKEITGDQGQEYVG